MTHMMIFCMYLMMYTVGDGKDTCDAFQEELAWSLFWCWMGKWPDTNSKGGTAGIDMSKARKDLAGGYFLTLFGVRCDLDFLKHLKMNSHGSLQPCGWCPANCSSDFVNSCPWTHFDFLSANWVKMIYTKWEWQYMNPVRCPILKLPGTSQLTVVPDWMHNKHMGTDMWFLGGVLLYLTFLCDSPSLAGTVPQQNKTCCTYTCTYACAHTAASQEAVVVCDVHNAAVQPALMHYSHDTCSHAVAVHMLSGCVVVTLCCIQTF